MAKEATLSFSLKVAKDSSENVITFGPLSIDVTGKQFVHGRQTVGSSEEAIVVGSDIGTPGYAVFVNRDTTNNVNIRAGTGSDNFALLKPGEGAVFRFATTATAPYAISTASTVDVEYWIFED